MSNNPPDTLAIITEISGKKRIGVWALCEGCGDWFAARLYKSKNSRAKVCSRSCRAVKVELSCSQCGCSFHRPKGKYEQSKKSNKTSYVFCSRKCKDAAQRIESIGFSELMPPHYGTGLSRYRENAINSFEVKCCDCEITHEALLEVHHKDGKRKNCNPNNLEIVCCNHHAVRHMKLNDRGVWVFSKKSLTPRDCIPDVRKLLGV